MALLHFSVPLQRQDLLAPTGPGSYRVETEYSIRELKTKLRDIQQDIQESGAKLILNGGFDVLFSVLAHFHKEIPPEYKQDAIEILCQGTEDVIRTTDLFLCSMDSGSVNEKKGYATRMKMIVYLLCQIVDHLNSPRFGIDILLINIQPKMVTMSNLNRLQLRDAIFRTLN